MVSGAKDNFLIAINDNHVFKMKNLTWQVPLEAIVALHDATFVSFTASLFTDVKRYLKHCGPNLRVLEINGEVRPVSYWWPRISKRRLPKLASDPDKITNLPLLVPAEYNKMNANLLSVCHSIESLFITFEIAATYDEQQSLTCYTQTLLDLKEYIESPNTVELQEVEISTNHGSEVGFTADLFQLLPQNCNLKLFINCFLFLGQEIAHGQALEKLANCENAGKWVKLALYCEFATQEQFDAACSWANPMIKQLAVYHIGFAMEPLNVEKIAAFQSIEILHLHAAHDDVFKVLKEPYNLLHLRSIILYNGVVGRNFLHFLRARGHLLAKVHLLFITELHWAIPNAMALHATRIHRSQVEYRHFLDKGIPQIVEEIVPELNISTLEDDALQALQD